MGEQKAGKRRERRTRGDATFETRAFRRTPVGRLLGRLQDMALGQFVQHAALHNDPDLDLSKLSVVVGSGSNAGAGGQQRRAPTNMHAFP